MISDIGSVRSEPKADHRNWNGQLVETTPSMSIYTRTRQTRHSVTMSVRPSISAASIVRSARTYRRSVVPSGGMFGVTGRQ